MPCTADLEVGLGREWIAREEFDVADVRDVRETAIGGRKDAMLQEHRRAFAVLVRFPEGVRSGPALREPARDL